MTEITPVNKICVVNDDKVVYLVEYYYIIIFKYQSICVHVYYIMATSV